MNHLEHEFQSLDLLTSMVAYNYYLFVKVCNYCLVFYLFINYFVEKNEVFLETFDVLELNATNKQLIYFKETANKQLTYLKENVSGLGLSEWKMLNYCLFLTEYLYKAIRIRQEVDNFIDFI